MEKKWRILQAPTLRHIVDNANELGLTKDDVIYFTQVNGIHLLVYYGEE